jgi:hypothetical protein
MAWNDLASNQTVSFTNLQDAVSTGVFLAKTSVPSSSEQVTKTDADTYIYVNTSYAPFSGKSANQLVVKGNMLPRCWCWVVDNTTEDWQTYTFTPCGGSPITNNIDPLSFVRICSSTIPTVSSLFVTVDICGQSGDAYTALQCTQETDCYGCSGCLDPCGGSPE